MLNNTMIRLNLLRKQHYNCNRTCTIEQIYRLFGTQTAATRKQKERVVVLGTGWGGFNLALHINQSKVDLTIISPRNHFVFTPLLPSVAVGTLELRCIQEPIRSILQTPSANTNSNFIQAKATSINVDDQTVVCQSIQSHNNGYDTFTVPYDKLVIAIGVKTNTFGIKSIEDNVHGGQQQYNYDPTILLPNSAYNEKHCIFYLKQLAHARAIRANIIDCFERASLPTISIQEKQRLLSFLIVGGGPTSCEFTAELHGTFCLFFSRFCVVFHFLFLF
jgi:NADH dehydrogenase FAD-containing subunit